jgi:hydrogenase/urease accessory protein HupE
VIPGAWLVAGFAEAHRPGLSYARIDREGLHVTFARPELGDRTDLLAEAAVSVDGAPCQLGPPTVAPVEGDGIETSATLACPPGERWTFEGGYLADFPAGHRQYLEAFGHSVAVLDASAPRASFAGDATTSSAGAVAVDFLELGVEHILTGADHLAFLLGLLLAARSLRDMALVVSGFTVAHSITLALAALQLVHVPPSIVEPAIALTIAFVAVENFFDPPVKRRLAITFCLGLIHGFGFAGILEELGLPGGQVALALVSFNLGVEAGQLAVVLPLLPVLLWLRQKEAWRRQGMRAASSVLALAGAAWFVERVLQ